MKSTLKIATVAAMTITFAMPASAKFDDGAGKFNSQGRATAGSAACEHALKSTGVEGSKYEGRIRECFHQADAKPAIEKQNNFHARKQMLEGNHKLQWQQGYTK